MEPPVAVVILSVVMLRAVIVVDSLARDVSLDLDELGACFGRRLFSAVAVVPPFLNVIVHSFVSYGFV